MTSSMYALFGGKISARSRRDKAVIRVSTALWRISKNKYLPPNEVTRVALALARHASRASNWQVTANKAMGYAEYVGMYQGMPILHPDDGGSRLVIEIQKLRKKKQIKPLDYELAIINVICNIR